MGGGFADHILEPWGEKTLKLFVHEAVEEELKLESALAKLHTKYKVVLLHYSPTISTLTGEPPEIFPFLGTSRLVEPIDAFNVSYVFHGHAHYGSIEGKTLKGIPVYNVSRPVLRKGKKEYFLVEI